MASATGPITVYRAQLGSRRLHAADGAAQTAVAVGDVRHQLPQAGVSTVERVQTDWRQPSCRITAWRDARCRPSLKSLLRRHQTAGLKASPNSIAKKAIKVSGQRRG